MCNIVLFYDHTCRDGRDRANAALLTCFPDERSVIQHWTTVTETKKTFDPHDASFPAHWSLTPPIYTLTLPLVLIKTHFPINLEIKMTWPEVTKEKE